LIEHVGRVGMIARWRPVHLGHAAVLKALCSVADEAVIGIGSANVYDARNPFTPAETTEMIGLALEGQRNWSLTEVQDLNDGPRWRAMVVELFGRLDLFVTDNDYVTTLLADDYRIVRPVLLVPPAERVPINGTMVRRVMAHGDDWREMVPPAVARYLGERGLDHRFRSEFGLETLAGELEMEAAHVFVG
jgi:nicotinamide-nucleotide adenylyltransferase